MLYGPLRYTSTWSRGSGNFEPRYLSLAWIKNLIGKKESAWNFSLSPILTWANKLFEITGRLKFYSRTSNFHLRMAGAFYHFPKFKLKWCLAGSELVMNFSPNLRLVVLMKENVYLTIWNIMKAIVIYLVLNFWPNLRFLVELLQNLQYLFHFIFLWSISLLSM